MIESKFNQFKSFIITMNATHLLKELKTYHCRDGFISLKDIKIKVQMFHYNDMQEIVTDLN